MLSDIERKLLRILYNDTRAGGRVPSINKLSIRTGKSPEDLHKALQSLVNKGFIEWLPDRHSDLQVIKAWEDHFRTIWAIESVITVLWNDIKKQERVFVKISSFRGESMIYLVIPHSLRRKTLQPGHRDRFKISSNCC